MFDNMYRGIVKKHGENGLCRVFVPSVMPQSYESSSTKLPWCEPAQPLFVGSTNGGLFQYPSIGSTVWVFFVDGDINYPVMFACSLGSKTNFTTDKYVIKTDKFTMEIDDTKDTTNISINTLNINATVNINGKTTITGDTTTTGNVSDSNPTTPTMAEMRLMFNSHIHPTPAGPSSPTAQIM